MTQEKMAGNRRHIISPTADIREVPDASAPRGKLETQLVFGEAFIVENEKDGWCQGHCEHDGYQGYVEAPHLSAEAFAPAHIITAARSHVYRDATMKSPLLTTLGFGSRLVLTGADENGYTQLANHAGWIYTKHVSPLAKNEESYVETARKFLETPYYWGGRSGFGIDCSGLVQVCLSRAGIAAPRDTEQQIELGHTHDRPHSGDFVFFKGHVGIMADQDNIIHANAHHMKVTLEPLWMAEERSQSGITAIRRMD